MILAELTGLEAIGAIRQLELVETAHDPDDPQAAHVLGDFPVGGEEIANADPPSMAVRGRVRPPLQRLHSPGRHARPRDDPTVDLDWLDGERKVTPVSVVLAGAVLVQEQHASG